MCLVKVRLEDGVGESVVRGPNRILYRIYLGKQADTLWRLFEISSYPELSLESGGCKFCRRFTAGSHVMLSNRTAVAPSNTSLYSNICQPCHCQASVIPKPHNSISHVPITLKVAE